MDDSYKTIEKPAEGLYREKGSRFLAFGFPVNNEEQVKGILAEYRKEYHDARHHCYAYRIGPHGEQFRMNDDGEPSGTAGKPIYGQLLSHDLTNMLILVVRYFGGIKLGTGGLKSAYRCAAADMIDHAVTVTRHVMLRYHITFPYHAMNTVMKIVKDEELEPENQDFGESCSMNIQVREKFRDRITGRLQAIPDIMVRSL